ncbi:MAG: CbiX/SirB N-terminal domain-containing protein [Rubrivivax sp.]|jgi:sirohydrochlorin cobaltochelatase|nr:CbiX/SirB N-terminal domain-containing protein [Rubrivivax sp.]
MTSDADAPHGLILFAHGARDPRWAAPFDEVARRVREVLPGLRVALAYLELMPPTLAEAGAQLARDGCTRITVLPMFLGSGGHVRHDLPLLAQALREAWPGVRVDLLDPIGEQPTVLAAMADAAAALVAGGAA